MSFTFGHLKKRIPGPAKIYRVVRYLFLGSLALLLVALSSPMVGEETIKEERSTKTINLLLDISGSMNSGLGNDTYNSYGRFQSSPRKIDVAAKVITEFLEKKKSLSENPDILEERVGIFLFSEKLFILQFPTFDSSLLLDSVGEINYAYSEFGNMTEPVVALRAWLCMILDESLEKIGLSSEEQEKEESRILDKLEDSSEEIYVPDLKIPKDFVAPAHTLVMLSDEKFSAADIPKIDNMLLFIRKAVKTGFLKAKIHVILIGTGSGRKSIQIQGVGKRYNVNDAKLLQSLMAEIARQEVSETLIRVQVRKKSLSLHFALASLLAFLAAFCWQKLITRSIP